MRLKKLNKTQLNLVMYLVNRPHFMNPAKTGMSFGYTNENKTPYMRIQKSVAIDQAIKLKEQWPEVFETKLISFRLCDLLLLDDAKARKLLNYQDLTIQAEEN